MVGPRWGVDAKVCVVEPTVVQPYVCVAVTFPHTTQYTILYYDDCL